VQLLDLECVSCDDDDDDDNDDNDDNNNAEVKTKIAILKFIFHVFFCWVSNIGNILL
jgi:hypothetical protein